MEIPTKNVQMPDVSTFIEKVVDIVCEYYKVEEDVIYSTSRNRLSVETRHMAWVLIKEVLPTVSYKQICSKFGLSDHTTVMHGLQKMRNLIEVDIEYTNIYKAIRSKIDGEIPIDFKQHKLYWGSREWRLYALELERKLSTLCQEMAEHKEIAHAV